MNRLLKNTLTLFLISLLSFTLFGCFGDDDDDDDSNGSSMSASLSGTAATGAAIVGTVKVIGANGVQSAVVNIGSDGKYTVDVAGLTAPFLVIAHQTTPAKDFYSFAPAANMTANVTPLTTMALTNASGRNPADLAANWQSQLAADPITTAEITTASQLVFANLQTQFTAAGLDATDFDIFTHPFTAGSLAGHDALLESIHDVNYTFGVGAPTFVIDLVDGSAADIPFNPAIPLNTLDFDGDTIGAGDNCPLVSNTNQQDSDGDSIGDVCDPTPFPSTGNNCDSGNSTLPAAIKGQIATLTFHINPSASGPYNDGISLLFSFCQNGSLMITPANHVVATTFTQATHVDAVITTWIDTVTALKWEVVVVNGMLGDVNLSNVDGSVFYGHFGVPPVVSGELWTLTITGETCFPPALNQPCQAAPVINGPTDLPAPADLASVTTQFNAGQPGVTATITLSDNGATRKEYLITYSSVLGPVDVTIHQNWVYTKNP